MKKIAVILAGGSGTRLNSGLPKQFIKVAGKMIIEHTIQCFQDHKEIDEIAIVCNPIFKYKIEDLVARNEFHKVSKVLNGGSERYESSLSAINAFKLEYTDCHLIFHDAVRPLVTQRIISDTISALKDYDVIDVAVPATDTIIKVANNKIDSIPNRSELMRGQTPQAFRLSVLDKAYKLALADENFQTTDDCGVVIKYCPKIPVYIVRGEESNMKLTYQEDLFLLEKLFQLKTVSSNTLSEEKRLFLSNKVIVVFGGSYGIGLEIIKLAKSLNMKAYSFSRNESNTDIANHEDVKKAIDQVLQDERQIDYIVNSAAILYKTPLTHLSYDEVNKIIQTNYTGMVNVAKESFPTLKKSQGQLLFFTSSSYTRGRMNYALYSSTKCAVVNFMQALSEEWRSFGICINCMNPERTKTPMRIKNFGDEPEETLLSSYDVAESSLSVLADNFSGQVVDIKLS